MIKNLGDFKKTLGVYEMKLDSGAVIEFKEGFNGDDLFDFGEILSSKGSSNARKFAEFIRKHMDKHNQFDSDWDESTKSRFIVQNLMHLIKGYMVMFEVTTAESFDKVMKSEAEKIKGENKSPIESEETN